MSGHMNLKNLPLYTFFINTSWNNNLNMLIFSMDIPLENTNMNNLLKEMDGTLCYHIKIVIKSQINFICR